MTITRDDSSVFIKKLGAFATLLQQLKLYKKIHKTKAMLRFQEFYKTLNDMLSNFEEMCMDS